MHFRGNRAESEGAWVLSSAGNHKIWVPNQERAHDSTRALPARVPYPTFGEEHNNDVNYNEDSPDEEGSTTLESPAKLIEDREEPSEKGKEEAEPEAVTNMGADQTSERTLHFTSGASQQRSNFRRRPPGL
jgi:hypothetical protein